MGNVLKEIIVHIVNITPVPISTPCPFILFNHHIFLNLKVKQQQQQQQHSEINEAKV